MQTLKEQIESQLVLYFGNETTKSGFIESCLLNNFAVNPDKINDIYEALEIARKDWDLLDVDIEGATLAQQKEIDRFLSETIDTIIEICLK